MADVLPAAREDALALTTQHFGVRVPAPRERPFHGCNCSVRAVAVTKTKQLPLFEQFFAVRRFSSALAFSADGGQVLFASNISGQFNLWRVPVDGGWPDQLTAFSDETVRGAGVSPRDGTILLCADHDGDEFHQLYVIRGGEGWPEQLTNEPEVQHFVGSAAWSPDGTKFAYAANARKPTDMECWVRDAESGETEPVFGEGMFSFPGPFSPDGSKLLALDFRNNSDMSVHLVDLDAGDTRELTPHEDDALFSPGPWAADGSGFYLVTDAGSEFRGLAFYDVGDVEMVSFQTFDGRDIPAWLYRPDVDGKAPVVLSIHGGPEAQERPVYQPLYQYLLSRGIGVLATNIRGSTGYGKSYQRLVQRDCGGGDMQDWEHAVKWLTQPDWVDEERIGVYGGSYGGFAVLTCVTRLPDYWAAAVDIFGPSNLLTLAKAVPPTWKRFIARFVGDPETEADFLMERSPITYVENVKTPLLVIQGATDPRVVKGESDQMVEKLRSLGREVQYVVFDDEGHGFTKRPNELKAYRLAAVC